MKRKSFFCLLLLTIFLAPALLAEETATTDLAEQAAPPADYEDFYGYGPDTGKDFYEDETADYGADPSALPVNEAMTGEAFGVDAPLPGAVEAISVEKPLAAIEKLKKQGSLLKAQAEYETLLAAAGLTAADRERVQKGYEALNWNILFANAKLLPLEKHKVVAGDALYNIAKKYKTTVDIIKKTNGLKNDVIYPGKELLILPADFSIEINKKENWLKLFLGGKPIKTYPVATGKDNSTPAGEFKITHKLENPTWYRTGAVIPPGSPENSLGTRWLGFDKKGYGIHGTTEPELIGQHVSLGCIRMLNPDVEEVYGLVPSGTPVTVHD
ncbi:MAG: L,D-transpeptidase family protein [Candidatus Omnitrophota bacterium]